ncbi:MAG: Aspartyl/glutamyl-tRNA(Asn/Gln) amidotransferase subunit B [Alphaproteobacteria bacterium MarineAlpha9_Bin4]|nr:MAG: Aspartyl/glutamyl-tRNA(Asn/Gln) amidotransferase subunit B [Alphaproteobacteria bacterium MarineAlpha9_Bin4]|tara:strand:- start:757 stop:2223 length:1467 start_codon:yes stop_codon:yes gene_type:complete
MTKDKPNTISGRSGAWEIVIGLEVHAQVSSKLKLFSNGSASFGESENKNLDLLDVGLPGTLPTINSYVIDQAIKSGLALNAKINNFSIFDRKNYFYPDLPLGYQISQYKDPIISNGYIDIDISEDKTKRIRIERLHLEQDAGKSIHDQSPDFSFIDFNRAGVALMEIVSYPDLSDWEEAGDYVTKLRNILRFANTCDGNMQEGSLRCDANVSVRKPNDPLGTRCEIKNLNSIKNLMRAIEFEANRQVKLIENGETIAQETRLFDANTGKTRTMRSKEEAHDYRYFPDPDLLPLEIKQERINEIKKTLPELPAELKERLKSQYNLGTYDAKVISAELETAKYFEELSKGRDAKQAANWVISNLFGKLNESDIKIENSPIPSQRLGELLDFINDGIISNKIAKEVFEDMFASKKNAKEIIDNKGLKQISNEDDIEKLVDQIIFQNETQVKQFKDGNAKVMGWFVGQVMKLSKGQANPGVVNKIILKKLNQ